MKSIWTVAEQHGGVLKAVSFELLARGRALADRRGAELVSVLVGHGVSDESLGDLLRHGADRVLAVQDPRLAEFVCESSSRILAALVETERPEIIIAAATTRGRTLMPHLAVRVNAGLTADCTELDIDERTGNLLQTRPAIGGNIMATITTPAHRPQMATVRPKSARPLEPDPERAGTIVHVPLDESLLDGRVVHLGWRREGTDFVNLDGADIVVAGGKGLKRAENFALLEELAKLMDGAVGASRDAVDRGWIGYPHQIGLSGRTISPKLYIGAGISGSIQHLAGIKTSETIVSVNSDPDAPLHRIADFAILGDLFLVLPELRRRLEARKAAGGLDD